MHFVIITHHFHNQCDWYEITQQSQVDGKYYAVKIDTNRAAIDFHITNKLRKLYQPILIDWQDMFHN